MGELVLKWLHFFLVSLYLGGAGLFLLATRQVQLGLTPGAVFGYLRRTVGA